MEIIIHEPERKLSRLQKKIRTNSMVALKYIDKDEIDVLTYKTSEISNDIYLTNVESDVTILDVLFKRYGDFFKKSELIDRIKKNKKIFLILLRNNLNFNFISNDIIVEFLLYPLDDTINYLDYIFKNNSCILEKFINSNNFTVINHLIYNKFCSTKEIDDKFINSFGYLIKSLPKELTYQLLDIHFEFFKSKISDKFFSTNVINYLVDKKEFDIIANMDEFTALEFVLQKIDNENTYLDYILKNNPNFHFNFQLNVFDLKPITSIFFKNHKYDVFLDNIDFKYLLLKYDGSKTYLDILLENFYSLKIDKQNKLIEYSLTDLNFLRVFLKNNKFCWFLNVSDDILNEKYDDSITILTRIMYLASSYINLYPNLFYLSMKNLKISNTILLQKVSEVTLLELLIKKMGKDSLLNILSDDNLKNSNIQLILKLNSVDLKQLYPKLKTDFGFDDILNNQKFDLLKSEFQKLSIGEISTESQELLNKFKIIFENDGTSDRDVIELAYNSFKMLLINKNLSVDRLIECIFDIKNNNPSFTLKKDDECYFSSIDNCISINNFNIYNIISFLHELGHAIHFYNGNFSIPQAFTSLYNNGFIFNEEEFNNFKDYIKKIFTELREKYKTDFYCDNEIAQEDSKRYINNYRTLLNTYRGKYSDDIIDYLEQNIPSKSEYKKMYNFVLLDEFVFESPSFNIFGSIIDIIDALNKGTVYEDGISFEDVKLKIGHGEHYYKEDEKVFSEIFAQFFTLKNYSNSDRYLEILKKIIGNELFEIVNNYYNEILNQQNIKKR